MKRVLGITGVALAAVALPCTALAYSAETGRGITIRVARGDSPANLAQRYYGRESARRALLLANGQSGLRRRVPRLRAGRRIFLVSAWSYRIRSGDTWESIASDYMGDRKHGRFLAELNKKIPSKPAPVGHVIIIPALLRYRTTRAMSVTKLASRLLETKERSPEAQVLGERIKTFNGLQSSDIAAKTRLVLPLADLQLLGWYLPTALPVGDPGTQRRTQKALAKIRRDLHHGRYLDAALRLGPLVTQPGLARAQRSELYLLQCTAYVALGRRPLARAAARAALKLDPSLKLDPVMISPKIRSVFQAVRRTIPGKRGN